jgi:penicillin G amidase
VLLAGGALAVQWFRTAARAAMPQLDGTLVVRGIMAPVTVVRDQHGVPSITAQSLDDLFFAQGYVTAQDRLWQMDMMRRFAAGELASALGGRYVEIDRQQRVLGLRQVAARSVAEASPEVRAQLEAYARGVNAYIAGHQHGLPLEMRVLRYFPHAWTAEDCALVGASMAEMLTHGIYKDKLNRERILQKLGPELTADLYPERSQRDIIPGHDLDETEPAHESQQQQQESRDQLQQSKQNQQQLQSQLPNPSPTTGMRSGSRHGLRNSGVRIRHKGARVEQTKIRGTTISNNRAQRLRVRHSQHSRADAGHPLKEQEQNQLAQASAQKVAKAAAPDLSHLVDQRAWDFVQSLQQGEMDAVRAGSNNWVISGKHTASGRPLLSNDMHLVLRLPNTWYEAHLHCAGAGCGDYDVAGVTLPGVPWVIVGHNRRIAWGFTYTGLDVEDVYVENFNNSGEYQTPGGWRKPQLRHEVIHVKRGLDRQMDVKITRHGPIISDTIAGENRQLALRWAVLQTGLTMPFYALNNAQNWEQFRAALSGFNGPGQNVVYADVDGNIGYQATGKAPVRAGGDGTLPVSGGDDAHEWTGYVPFDELPSVYNPPSGIVATANGRITPDTYKYSLTKEWESPYRTERIYHVLRQDKKFTAADMLALQNDVQSDLDRFVAQRMVYAVDRTPGASARVRNAAEILRHFDGALTVDSAGAAIEQRARAWLMKTLLESKLGDDADLYHWFMNTVWLENVVAFQPARWLPQKYGNWDALLVAAIDAAVNAPDAPRDLSAWKYGDISTIEIAHPIFGTGLFGKLPSLKRNAATGRWPQPGNGITVKQVGMFEPSERFTADLSDLDHSTINIVNGQSGNLFSPYFNDQFEAWYRGTTLQLPFAPETVERTAAHRLTLVAE